MRRALSFSLFAAAVATAQAVFVAPAAAQTTYYACRVPTVGVIYMVADAAAACLDAAHVKFNWTDGGAPADGSVTTPKIADGAVTAAKIAANAVTAAAVANGAITTAKLAVPPRVSYTAGSATSVTLGATHVNVQSVAITVAGAGQVAVNAVGTLEAFGGNCNYVYYGITKTSAGTPSNNQISYLNRPDFGATGVSAYGYASMSSVFVDTVASAGTYTYYFSVRSGTGTCNAFPNGMTAVFIPT